MRDLFEEFANSADSDDEGRANSDDGRQMGVATPEPQGMDALVAVLSSIALLGLPAKGAVTTAAVGSKL